jgi:hypothetical protein
MTTLLPADEIQRRALTRCMNCLLRNTSIPPGRISFDQCQIPGIPLKRRVRSNGLPGIADAQCRRRILFAILRKIPPVHPDVGPDDLVRSRVAMTVAALHILVALGTYVRMIPLQFVVIVAPASHMTELPPRVLVASGAIDPDRILVRELGKVVVGSGAAAAQEEQHDQNRCRPAHHILTS